MTNTERYFNSICSFRKDLQELNDRYRPKFERLERFKDSASYMDSKRLLDDRRGKELAALRYEYDDRLKSAVDAMERTYMARPTSAPTQEQLAILQALKMRDHVSRDELRQAAINMRGCPVAERTLEEIARKSGVYLGLKQELSEDTVRRNIYSLRRSGEKLVARLDELNSRKAHMDNRDWDMFHLDVDPENEADCLRIFALCDDPAQLAAAVNETTD